MLDNARSQEGAQKHDVRRRAELLRKRRKLTGSALPEEKGRRLLEDKDRGDYASYIPLHEQWRAYFSSLLSSDPAGGGGGDEGGGGDSGRQDLTAPSSSHATLQKRILSADLHGCSIRVVDAKCHSDINIRGIVVRESSRTFHIITPKNKFKIIPKVGHVFGFELGDQMVTLYGNGLLDRMKMLEAMALRGKGHDGKRLTTTAL